ncbi:MAG: hypothetical protein ACXVKK_12980 [Flavisolibacter sp.]
MDQYFKGHFKALIKSGSLARIKLLAADWNREDFKVIHPGNEKDWNHTRHKRHIRIQKVESNEWKIALVILPRDYKLLPKIILLMKRLR